LQAGDHFGGHGTGRAAPGLSTAVRTFSRGQLMLTISAAHIQPIVALIAGVLILIMPRLLNYIVAIYLIVVGITGLGILR
jgi:hypothetical protein